MEEKTQLVGAPHNISFAMDEVSVIPLLFSTIIHLPSRPPKPWVFQRNYLSLKKRKGRKILLVLLNVPMVTSGKAALTQVAPRSWTQALLRLMLSTKNSTNATPNHRCWIDGQVAMVTVRTWVHDVVAVLDWLCHHQTVNQCRLGQTPLRFRRNANHHQVNEEFVSIWRSKAQKSRLGYVRKGDHQRNEMVILNFMQNWLTLTDDVEEKNKAEKASFELMIVCTICKFS